MGLVDGLDGDDGPGPTVISASTARWEQAFSVDGERTWVTNWVMEFARRGSS